MKYRTAVIKIGLFKTYTGTYATTSYTFLCWDDDVDVKSYIDDVYNHGGDVIKIDIPCKQLLDKK